MSMHPLLSRMTWIPLGASQFDVIDPNNFFCPKKFDKCPNDIVLSGVWKISCRAYSVHRPDGSNANFAFTPFRTRVMRPGPGETYW